MALGSIALSIVPHPGEPECAEVRVMGTVGGLPVDFMLDTGASRTQLIDRAELAIQLGGEGDQSFGVFGGVRVREGIVQDVTIGPIASGPLTVDVVAATERAFNLLGMDVLSRYCCEVRFGDAVDLSAANATLVPDEPDPRIPNSPPGQLVDGLFGEALAGTPTRRRNAVSRRFGRNVVVSRKCQSPIWGPRCCDARAIRTMYWVRWQA